MNSRMAQIMTVGCIVLAVGLFVGCACVGKGGKHSMAKATAMQSQSAYVCPDCHVLALKAGDCPMCKKAMIPTHVLGVKDGNAMLCGCGQGCKCGAAGMKDGKCSCGKAVVTASVKGLYVCPAGCPEISDKPGKCMCGKDLIKVE